MSTATNLSNAASCLQKNKKKGSSRELVRSNSTSAKQQTSGKNQAKVREWFTTPPTSVPALPRHVTDARAPLMVENAATVTKRCLVRA